MKIALAACSGMSSDQPLARRLGDDYQATVRVSGAADREQEVYPLLEEVLEIDLSGLERGREGTACSTRGQPGGRAGVHGRANAEIGNESQLPGRRCRTIDDVRLTAWVHGRVQGVGFRWWTRSRALELGLTGYAANRPDGRVQVVAQGPRDACEQLLRLLRGGETPGHVDNVVVDWSPRGEAISGFVER